MSPENNFQRIQLKVIDIYPHWHTWKTENQIDDLNKLLGDIPAENIISINTIERDNSSQVRVFLYYKTTNLEYNICKFCGGHLKREEKSADQSWKYKFKCCNCGELFDDRLNHIKQVSVKK